MTLLKGTISAPPIDPSAPRYPVDNLGQPVYSNSDLYQTSGPSIQIDGSTPLAVSQTVHLVQRARIIKQLADLSSFALDVFQGLDNQANLMFQRIESLQSRLGQIKQVIFLVQEKMNEQHNTCGIDVPRSDWRAQQPISQLFSKENADPLIQKAYDQCAPLPNLSALDKFREDGKSSYMFYSYPQFFMEKWMELMEKDIKRKKKTKKSEEAPAETSQSRLPASNTNSLDRKFAPTNAVPTISMEPAASSPLSTVTFQNKDTFIQKSNTMDIIKESEPAPEFASLQRNAENPYLLNTLKNNNMLSEIHVAEVSTASLDSATSQVENMSIHESWSKNVGSLEPIKEGTITPEKIPPAPPANLSQYATLKKAGSSSLSIEHIPPAPQLQPQQKSNTIRPPAPPPIPPTFATVQASASPGAPPPPPPPPPAESRQGSTITSELLSSAASNLKSSESFKRAPTPADPRNALMDTIKGGAFNLRKAQVQQKKTNTEQRPVGNDVASILMRRVAIEESDSDSEKSDESDSEWN